MATTAKRLQLVVLGGGTGIHPVLLAARHLPFDITSIVTVADSGGSTGILRELYGFPAVGDLRQSITGMTDPASQKLVAQLLEYRFKKGAGLKGHTLGNLLLTALQDITKSTTEAVATVTKIFDIAGTVLPVTEKSTQLQITYADGSSVVGQHHLNEKTDAAKKIDHLSFVPSAPINPAAQAALRAADIIVIGPGDYHDSLLATLLVDGMQAVFRASSAQIVYVVNLMTSATRTKGMTARDHLSGIEAAIGKKVTTVLCNSEPIPETVALIYAAEDSYPVQDDLSDDSRVIRANLISSQLHVQDPADIVQRSLLRHSGTKITDILETLI